MLNVHEYDVIKLTTADKNPKTADKFKKAVDKIAKAVDKIIKAVDKILMTSLSSKKPAKIHRSNPQTSPAHPLNPAQAAQVLNKL